MVALTGIPRRKIQALVRVFIDWLCAQPNDPPNAKTNHRIKSKLWYFMTRINPTYLQKLIQPITEREIIKSTQHQQNARLIGTDHIPPEIYKSCKTWFTPLLKELCAFLIDNQFHETWETNRHSAATTQKWKSG